MIGSIEEKYRGRAMMGCPERSQKTTNDIGGIKPTSATPLQFFIAANRMKQSVAIAKQRIAIDPLTKGRRPNGVKSTANNKQDRIGVF